MRQEDLLNTLIAESQGHLQELEPMLLELEKRGDECPERIVNGIFRAVHSIKGGFGFLAIEPIVQVAHLLESVMARVRQHEVPVTPELVDALLKGVDALRGMIEDIAHVDSFDIRGAVEVLTPLVTEVAQEKPSPAAQSPESGRQQVEQSQEAIGSEVANEAARHGRFVYRISVDGAGDVSGRGLTWKDVFSQWERYGEIIASEPGRTELERRRPRRDRALPSATVTFGSVLEADLVAKAIGISEKRIEQVDLSTVRTAKPGTAGPDSGGDSPGAEPGTASRKLEQGDGVIWVKVDLLNRLMTLAGELVLARNQLLQKLDMNITDIEEVGHGVSQAVDAVRRLEVDSRKRSAGGGSGLSTDELSQAIQERLGVRLGELASIRSVMQHLDMVTSSLQESILLTRMQPLSVVFGKFPRVVRDLARKLEKELELVVEGHDVELDKSIIELLSDPLMHLVRNAAGHGIESPDVRERRGKPRRGAIGLTAFQEGGKVVVVISDDGAGLDVAALQERAVELGVVTPSDAGRMSQRELQMLIFAPGMSTAQTVSDLSGRGVGMDVVRTNVERLGGSVEVDSQAGRGMSVKLQLPLTLAIIPSLIVKTEGCRFTIPQVALEEIVRVKGDETTSRIERIHTHEVLRLRDELLPLVRLTDVLGIQPTFVSPDTGEVRRDRRSRWSDRRGVDGEDEQEDVPPDAERRRRPDRRTQAPGALKVVVLRLDTRRYGLVVDDVDDNEEIVVKPLPEWLKDIRCYSGATIMGDGRVAMILDPGGIAECAGLQFEEIDKAKLSRTTDADSEATTGEELLLFSAGSEEQLAVRLSSVARIEKLSPDALERVGNKTFVRYAESSLRLLRIHDYVPLSPPSAEAERSFVLVPKSAEGRLGFAISKVADTVRVSGNLDQESVEAPGIIGLTVLDERLVVVVDLDALVPADAGHSV